MIAWARQEPRGILLIDPESGSVERLPIETGKPYARLLPDQSVWWYKWAEREIWRAQLPDGEPELLARLPDELPARVSDLTCDGRLVLLREAVQESQPSPTCHDPETYWKYIERPRSGAIWTYDVQTGNAQRILQTSGATPDHLDPSPIDPTLIRYCLDLCEALGQRVWSIRTDGSGQRMIRPQEPGEMITHEFWWPDGESIGFTYQDRRGDEMLRSKPLAEYCPRPTQLGIADLDGNQLYLSDPLNCYHTHLYVSRDGKWVSGEGTDGTSFVFAAPLSRSERKIALKPLASVHTPYVPFAGQHVNCDFSADGRWLLYNDTINGTRQVCAVRVEG